MSVLAAPWLFHIFLLEPFLQVLLVELNLVWREQVSLWLVVLIHPYCGLELEIFLLEYPVFFFAIHGRRYGVVRLRCVNLVRLCSVIENTHVTVCKALVKLMTTWRAI